jgi:hypothetical protein
MKYMAFWVVMPHNSETARRFGGADRPHLYGLRVRISRNRQTPEKNWRLMRYIPPKHLTFAVTFSYIMDGTSTRWCSQWWCPRCSQHPPPLPEIRIHVSIEIQRRYTALPQSLKPSVVLLPLYNKLTVTLIVPLPSACCSIGSDIHTNRCFLWGSNWVFKAGHNAFNSHHSSSRDFR